MGCASSSDKHPDEEYPCVAPGDAGVSDVVEILDRASLKSPRSSNGDNNAGFTMGKVSKSPKNARRSSPRASAMNKKKKVSKGSKKHKRGASAIVDEPLTWGKKNAVSMALNALPSLPEGQENETGRRVSVDDTSMPSSRGPKALKRSNSGGDSEKRSLKRSSSMRLYNRTQFNNLKPLSNPAVQKGQSANLSIEAPRNNLDGVFRDATPKGSVRTRSFFSSGGPKQLPGSFSPTGEGTFHQLNGVSPASRKLAPLRPLKLPGGSGAAKLRKVKLPTLDSSPQYHAAGQGSGEGGSSHGALKRKGGGSGEGNSGHSVPGPPPASGRKNLKHR
mmetsp:Transcript_43950/g.85975  ORF Transcript_43950/g.85975 Transcript_43950/m.85975 type:complete len:332 (-) Transcript_43950:12-1007(-)